MDRIDHITPNKSSSGTMQGGTESDLSMNSIPSRPGPEKRRHGSDSEPSSCPSSTKRRRTDEAYVEVDDLYNPMRLSTQINASERNLQPRSEHSGGVESRQQVEDKECTKSDSQLGINVEVSKIKAFQQLEQIIDQKRGRFDRTAQLLTPAVAQKHPDVEWIKTKRLVTNRPNPYYLVQKKPCNGLQPHKSEHWSCNGTPLKCTACSEKAADSGACRFKDIRAFAAVQSGSVIDRFEPNQRNIGGYKKIGEIVVQSNAQPGRKIPKTFRPAIEGFRGAEWPDLKNWILLGDMTGYQALERHDNEIANWEHSLGECSLSAPAKDLHDLYDFPNVDSNVSGSYKSHADALHDIKALTAPVLRDLLSSPYVSTKSYNDPVEGETRTTEDSYPFRCPIVFRNSTKDERVTCDACAASCYLGSWVCVACGKELCEKCWQLIDDSVEPYQEDIKQSTDPEKQNGEHSSSMSTSGDSRSPLHAPLESESDILGTVAYFIPRVHQCLNRMRHTKYQFYMLVRENIKQADRVIHKSSLPSVGTLKRFRLKYTGLEEEILRNPRPFGIKILSHTTPDIGSNHLPGPDIIYQSRSQSHEQLKVQTAFFQSTWFLGGDPKLGKPLIVKGMLDRMDRRWDPTEFIEGKSKEKCALVDCCNDMVIDNQRVYDFFEGFRHSTYRGQVRSLKLKDWPPNADFKDYFPELFEDFERALPFPAFMSREGLLNLGAYFPPDFLRPDLGPKAYCAYPAPQFLPRDNGHEVPKGLDGIGTTNLHKDVTCAINIMIYASPAPILEERAQKGKEYEVRYDDSNDPIEPSCYKPAAIWHIWQPGSSDMLNNYLRYKYPERNIDDPVNRQKHYLSDQDLAEMNTERWGYTKSYLIHQEPGDAVLIPAGCPHQVTNGRSSIKVAVDFVTAERIHVLPSIIAEFRDLAAQYHYPPNNTDGDGQVDAKNPTVGRIPRLSRILAKKGDVLRLPDCLVHAWNQILFLEQRHAKLRKIDDDTYYYGENGLHQLLMAMVARKS